MFSYFRETSVSIEVQIRWNFKDILIQRHTLFLELLKIPDLTPIESLPPRRYEFFAKCLTTPYGYSGKTFLHTKK